MSQPFLSQPDDEDEDSRSFSRLRARRAIRLDSLPNIYTSDAEETNRAPFDFPDVVASTTDDTAMPVPFAERSVNIMQHSSLKVPSRTHSPSNRPQPHSWSLSTAASASAVRSQRPRTEVETDPADLRHPGTATMPREDTIMQFVTSSRVPSRSMSPAPRAAVLAADILCLSSMSTGTTTASPLMAPLHTAHGAARLLHSHTRSQKRGGPAPARTWEDTEKAADEATAAEGGSFTNEDTDVRPTPPSRRAFVLSRAPSSQRPVLSRMASRSWTTTVTSTTAAAPAAGRTSIPPLADPNQSSATIDVEVTERIAICETVVTATVTTLTDPPAAMGLTGTDWEPARSPTSARPEPAYPPTEGPSVHGIGEISFVLPDIPPPLPVAPARAASLHRSPPLPRCMAPGEVIEGDGSTAGPSPAGAIDALLEDSFSPLPRSVTRPDPPMMLGDATLPACVQQLEHASESAVEPTDQETAIVVAAPACSEAAVGATAEAMEAPPAMVLPRNSGLAALLSADSLHDLPSSVMLVGGETPTPLRHWTREAYSAPSADVVAAPAVDVHGSVMPADSEGLSPAGHHTITLSPCTPRQQVAARVREGAPVLWHPTVGVMDTPADTSGVSPLSPSLLEGRPSARISDEVRELVERAREEVRRTRESLLATLSTHKSSHARTAADAGGPDAAPATDPNATAHAREQHACSNTNHQKIRYRTEWSASRLRAELPHLAGAIHRRLQGYDPREYGVLPMETVLRVTFYVLAQQHESSIGDPLFTTPMRAAAVGAESGLLTPLTTSASRLTRRCGGRPQGDGEVNGNTDRDVRYSTGAASRAVTRVSPSRTLERVLDQQAQRAESDALLSCYATLLEAFREVFGERYAFRHLGATNASRQDTPRLTLDESPTANVAGGGNRSTVGPAPSADPQEVARSPLETVFPRLRQHYSLATKRARGADDGAEDARRPPPLDMLVYYGVFTESLQEL